MAISTIPREAIEASVVYSVQPAGAVMMFAGPTPPIGWLKANGAIISRTVYAELFNAIGVYWGAGDGSTTFQLPDLRGEFLRCWDDGRGVDSGRALGTQQAQSWKTLWVNEVGFGWNGGYSHGIGEIPQSAENGYYGAHFTGHWANPSAASSFRYGTQEVRPRNRSTLACIKY